MDLARFELIMRTSLEIVLFILANGAIGWILAKVIQKD
jgi:hypothetical protein